MDQVFKEWLSLAAVAISVGGVVYSWLTSGSKKALADLEAHKNDVSERHERIIANLETLDRRVQQVESDMKHLPDKDMLHALHLSMGDLKVDIARIASTAEQAARGVSRVESFLRKGEA